MKLFKKNTRNNETQILHSYPEFDRIPSDYPISQFIIDDLNHAESKDKKLFSQIKSLDPYNSRLQDPNIKSLYNLERTRAYEESLNKQETLYAIHMTNMGAWKEASEIEQILEEDHRRYIKELEDFGKLHSIDGAKGGK